VQALAQAGIPCEVDADRHPNITSSYVVEDVFHNTTWLREGVYKDILDLFDYQPQLKINLIDRNQTFIPFFTGNLNFITSDTPNYWYLHLRFPKTNALYCCGPFLPIKTSFTTRRPPMVHCCTDS
jgi:hypothetical protein